MYDDSYLFFFLKNNVLVEEGCQSKPYELLGLAKIIRQFSKVHASEFR
ncbi:hypothetical protein M899_2050 [Bacteriovorax sp. BSW11_IV]|nr:hypothetical protein M899_2050 [Bacteriovorax sp. BSW11_IV]